MLEAIDAAQDSILFETYIWKNDEVGQRFVDAFNAAARRVYECSCSTMGSPIWLLHPLFTVSCCQSCGRGPLHYTGLNHSKILVVDAVVGFVSGYNIGSLYAHQWCNAHLRVTGHNVWGLRQSIARVWNDAHDPDEQIPWIAPENGDAESRVAANLPIQLVYPIRNMHLQVFERAKNHIWATTAYFIPDQQILQASLRQQGGALTCAS